MLLSNLRIKTMFCKLEKFVERDEIIYNEKWTKVDKNCVVRWWILPFCVTDMYNERICVPFFYTGTIKVFSFA